MFIFYDLHFKRISCGKTTHRLKLATFVFSILVTFSLLFLLSGRAEALFFDQVEKQSLHQFFGDLRGNFIDPDTFLSEQVGEGLEIGLATSGKAISQFPDAGNETFLDSGGVYQDLYDDKGAVIITRTGRILAAALLSVTCIWIDEKRQEADCGDGSQSLTIFVRDPAESGQAERVFKQWANQIVYNPPVKIILLKGYGDRLIN